MFTLKPFLDSTVYTISDSCFVSKQQNESGILKRPGFLSNAETFAMM